MVVSHDDVMIKALDAANLLSSNDFGQTQVVHTHTHMGLCHQAV